MYSYNLSPFFVYGSFRYDFVTSQAEWSPWRGFVRLSLRIQASVAEQRPACRADTVRWPCGLWEPSKQVGHRSFPRFLRSHIACLIVSFYDWEEIIDDSFIPSAHRWGSGMWGSLESWVTDWTIRIQTDDLSEEPCFFGINATSIVNSLIWRENLVLP